MINLFRGSRAQISLFGVIALNLTIILFTGGAAAFAQETRGSIIGTISDASGAVVPGVAVTITNAGTNVSTEVTSNESGSFEAPFLQPGTYSVSAAAPNFKKFVQQNVVVNVGSRANIDVVMEVGAVTEEVVVTSTAPLLDTASGSGAAVLDNQAIRNLPVFGNSALLAVRTLPGIQWTGAPNYLGLHSNAGASAISAAGGAGGTEFVLDGIPNSGINRRAGFLPHTDAVEEVRVSSSEFDATEGHTAGATISMVTKSGTNGFHGSLSYLHWQQRFNATQSTTNGAYWGNIYNAEASGNTALAEQLRAQPRQPSGRSNTYAVNIGGPIYLPSFGEGGPSFFSGKDKLFFFFSYNGYKESKSEEAVEVNRTVPTAAHRRGDFSDLLALGQQYQIYDPRTARLEGGRVVRSPFPNNQVPILNPSYNAIARLYPLPNGNPAATRDGLNNYLASATPFDWDYTAYQNRIDYNISQSQKLTGKWSYNDFLEDRGDWLYETARGLQSNGLVRRNIGVGLDYVRTLNPTTFLRFTVGYNRFIEGNQPNATQLSFSPGSIGLPGYVDERAGNLQSLPFIDFSTNSYSDIGRAYPGFTRVSVATTGGELSKSFNRHTLRAGYDLRQNYRTTNNPGNASGRFAFNNSYVRPRDDAGFGNPALIGLEWAALMLGVPGTVELSTNDTLYLTNPFGGGYVQDDWRVSPKLTLNLGFRYELEGGFRERYNRGLGQFDPNIELPISAAAEAAYARNPIPEVPASQFDVRGGTQYLGVNGAPRTLNNAKSAYMPRVGFAYQLNDRTVLRGGYGLFYDTNNVLNNGLDQFGFNRNTGTLLSSDNGLTFQNTNLTSAGCQGNSANCNTIFSDPFPVLPNGTRFLEPFGNQLGNLARVGRNFDYVFRDWERSRQQRWRFGVQRELSGNLVLEIAYLGSYTDNMSTVGNNPGEAVTQRRLSVLPQQYWSTGLVRNQANATFLTTNVRNPFNIANFSFLQTENPLAYQDFQSNGFLTNANIQRHQLLRPFSLYSAGDGLRATRVPDVTLKYHHLETSLTKRFSQGISSTLSYTWGSSQVRDFLENEFDERPVYRQNLNYRPHSFRAHAVYELPFGRGRRFLSGDGFLSKLVGGWQIAPIYNLQSGRTYDFPNLFFMGDTRDIKLPDDERTTDQWFNWRLFPRAQRDYSQNNPGPYRERIRQIVPVEFLPPGRTYDTVVPTDFQPADFHVRVFPSRFNHLRGDVMTQLDLNIQRTFAVTEGVRMEFKTDFINAANNVQWNNPSTDVTSDNFGRVTEQYNTPRWIQFQFRLTF